MRNAAINFLADRLKGTIVLALILFGALVVSGSPDIPSVSPEAIAANPVGGTGPYHTLDDF